MTRVVDILAAAGVRVLVMPKVTSPFRRAGDLDADDFSEHVLATSRDEDLEAADVPTVISGPWI